ncbi:MAG TPA: DsbE family thiol:disulfide interchange protein [Thiotrichales bacterium]|nr:DsbE family thiol:disulfide interchange protein [Thiotrichales bacterium]
MSRYLIPLGLFAALVVLLGIGLTLNPREVPSPLIGKPAPEFDLATVMDPNRRISRKSLLGKVYLFNVWASWCVSCRQEHPLLVELSRKGVVDIYGLNYKDQREDAQRWLNYYGNPYVASGADTDGRVGIDWGVYGVPETFVIDAKGMIRHKHIGPVTPEALEEEILPLVKKLKEEASSS